MGQILNRIKDIVSSEINSHKSSQIDESQSIDLDQIINELNSSNSDLKHKNETYNDDNQNNKEYLKNIAMTEAQANKILELPENATIEMIKSAYKQKMMEYHPDRVSNLGKELQNLAVMKTKEINQAYEFLKKLKNIQ